MRVLTISIAAAALSACATASSTTPRMADRSDSVEVMVLGSFHMGNPGRDVVNAEIESMLTERRQSEIAAAIQAIAAFRPSVVAVERIANEPDYADLKFGDFSSETLKTVADERVQLGYRLAALEGITRVYGIDEQPGDGEPDYFPFGKLMEHAEATGQSQRLNEQIATVQRQSKEFESLQKDKTVAELLIVMNADPGMASADLYYDTFRFDRGEKQPGAELQAYWFMRNAKIFSKLAQVTKPGDRVVVIYGAGHKHWLDHFAAHTPGFTSVDPTPYLEQAVK